MGITVFLPCRAGSERVPNKNKRPFGDLNHGLIQLKLKQLADARLVDSVIVSTDDAWIYANAAQYSNIEAHWRDPDLCRSDTSTDELIPHAVDLIPTGDILWTHCTSPFVTAKCYDAMIQSYYELGGHDSLMTVDRVQDFYWQDNAPMYSTSRARWPRTQTLKPVERVTSGGFIAHSDIYRQRGDRVGHCPKLFDVGMVAGMDIDTLEDFELAEHLYTTGYAAT